MAAGVAGVELLALIWLAAARPAVAVSALQPAPVALFVDDFEDRNGYPRAKEFDNWEVFSYPHEQLARYGFDVGYESGTSLQFQWALEDFRDDKLDHAGAGLRALAHDDYIDLSGYTRLVVSHRHEAHSPIPMQCKSSSQLTFSVSCRELDKGEKPSFEASVPLSATWKTSVIPLTDLHEPAWRPPSGITVSECLRVADVVAFRIDAPSDVHDGECQAGMLWLDNMSLR